MNSILAAIGVTLSALMKLGLPPNEQPVVESVPLQQIQGVACINSARCENVYVFTEPTTGKILVADGVDWTTTLAEAELAREYGRWLLSKHQIYSPMNSCKENVRLERALRDIEWDYIKIRKNEGKFKGINPPPTKDDLPEHVFFCVPDGQIAPRTRDNPEKLKNSINYEVPSVILKDTTWY